VTAWDFITVQGMNYRFDLMNIIGLNVEEVSSRRKAEF